MGVGVCVVVTTKLITLAMLENVILIIALALVLCHDSFKVLKILHVQYCTAAKMGENKTQVKCCTMLAAFVVVMALKACIYLASSSQLNDGVEKIKTANMTIINIDLEAKSP